MADGREEPVPLVRSCCGRRHFGAQCPDGLVRCCICFKRVTVRQLSVTFDGDLEDVCQDCAEKEQFPE